MSPATDPGSGLRPPGAATSTPGVVSMTSNMEAAAAPAPAMALNAGAAWPSDMEPMIMATRHCMAVPPLKQPSVAGAVMQTGLALRESMMSVLE